MEPRLFCIWFLCVGHPSFAVRNLSWDEVAYIVKVFKKAEKDKNIHVFEELDIRTHRKIYSEEDKNAAHPGKT